MNAPEILVADDDVALRGLYKELLERSGYRVEVVGTAKQALDAVERLARIDAVVLDLQMPGELRGDAVVALISVKAPVIVVTGSADDALEHRLRADGAFAFLRKPFNVVELIDSVREAVESRRATRQ